MRARQARAGFTLIELLSALVAATIVVGALNSVLHTALQARAVGRQGNELAYQGRFALERMVEAARAAAPVPLTTPAPGMTGSWFAPVMYCLKGGNRLVVTTPSDNACTGSTVLAQNVTAFSAQPAAGGALDDPVGTLSITLQAGGAPVILTTSVRLGGGTK